MIRMNTTKSEEVAFKVRMYQIEHLGSDPKTKTKLALKKDQAITTIINQHKSNQISTRQLLTQYIN